MSSSRWSHVRRWGLVALTVAVGAGLLWLRHEVLQVASPGGQQLTDLSPTPPTIPPGLPSHAPQLVFTEPERDPMVTVRHAAPPDLPDPSNPPRWTTTFAVPHAIETPDPSIPPPIYVDISRGTPRQQPARASLDGDE